MIKSILETVARVGRGGMNASLLEGKQGERLSHLREHGYVMFDHLVGTERFQNLQADFQNRLENELQFEMPCLAQSRIDPERDADLIDNNFLATVSEMEKRGVTFSRDDIKSYKQAIKDFAPSTLKLPMVDTQDYFDLWLDEEILDIVEAYMGFKPVLTEAYIRRNFPARFKVMNHHWHRDRNHQTHLLKGFIFLSDCDLTNGPHHYIAGSATGPELRGKNYYTSEEIHETYGADSDREIISVVKAGTIILEDTRGLHKAGVPDKGFRDLGFSVFMPPMAFRSWGDLYNISEETHARLSERQQSYIPKANVTRFS